MNCKQGDLAVSLIPTALYGKICTVRNRAAVGEIDSIGCITTEDDDMGPRWNVEFHNPIEGYRFVGFYDCYLRPLRDVDGEDEILRIAGKPADLLIGAAG